VLKTPRVQAKLEMALGKDGAEALVKSAEQEAKMLAFERRYGPGQGSPTQEFAAAMREQDGGAGLQGVATDFGARLITQGPRGAVTGSLASGVQKLGALSKTAGMPVRARDEAGRLLMLSPDEFRQHMALAPRPPGLFGGGVPRPSLYGATSGGILSQLGQ